MSKLGILQSRGLGDLVIALPIAKYYADQGHEIYWPICEPFWASVKDHAPWVKWIPIPVDAKGDFFYVEPMKRLKAFGVSETICLYQSLNVMPELAQVPYFQIQHFDEFKYSRAGVPFLDKWKLAVFSNIIDQLKIDVDKYWIPRSHIHQTPVLGTAWTILEAPEGSGAAQRIFGAN